MVNSNSTSTSDEDVDAFPSDAEAADEEDASTIWRSMSDGCSRCASLQIECVVDVTKGRVVKCENCRKEGREQAKCKPTLDKRFCQRNAQYLKKRRRSKSEMAAASTSTAPGGLAHETPSKMRKIEMTQTDRTPKNAMQSPAIRALSPSRKKANGKGKEKQKDKDKDKEVVSTAPAHLEGVRVEPEHAPPPPSRPSTPCPSLRKKAKREMLEGSLKKKQLRRITSYLNDIVDESHNPSTVRYLARKVAEEHGVTLQETRNGENNVQG